MDLSTKDGLFRLIDIYCERTNFTFWSEPANALTNLFIFLAGAYGLLLLNRVGSKSNRSWLLILSINAMTIGVGSFLFHTFANGWSMLTDVIPISVFMVLFLTWSLIYLLKLPTLGIVASITAFIATGAVLGRTLPKDLLNGSATYLHALITLMIIGHLIRNTHKDIARLFIVAITVFTVSLTFRSIDLSICDSFPLGTHFLWHTLNGYLLYIFLKIVATADRAPQA